MFVQCATFDQVEKRIFDSIHEGLGLSCTRRARSPRPLVSSENEGIVSASRNADILLKSPRSVRSARSVDYALRSVRGIVPIDRYALVGPRTRDAIHPMFNAQFGVVQLMLNHMCRAG